MLKNYITESHQISKFFNASMQTRPLLQNSGSKKLLGSELFRNSIFFCIKSLRKTFKLWKLWKYSSLKRCFLYSQCCTKLLEQCNEINQNWIGLEMFDICFCIISYHYCYSFNSEKRLGTRLDAMFLPNVKPFQKF